MGRFPLPVDDLPNFVGELELPLNYPQLSEALRHCKDFLGRKGVNVVASARKNTLFRSFNADKLIVDDRKTGRDNLFIHNTNWFAYMWPGSSNMYIKGMYKDYIHAFKYHDYGWY